ncbi:hypothetical protein CMQ_4406 [Grosmannia clavigera kw1407]|uniref:Uncharacterized protein n=1 Tax=Grosmannia clavigera (strain kw1407 / UAMH 11150) TaxID=655863 RepID=F0XU04_GROCL|nr:uncharacterized protein CMQ_4406 [Grosmannia clavigera kw1407]EFW98554.1 hypothetical protein CMQ_4406 [Grosmannia clavigera kw1407]
MASELQWVPHFCLTCDKQTDGATYCSESCRLADFEETSSFSSYSNSNSPTWAAPATTYPWSSSSTSRKAFHLTPAYDFSNPQPYGTTPGHYHYPHNYSNQYTTPRRSAAPTSALYSSASTSVLPPTTSATATATTSVTYRHVLSPSSSHSSLSSMRSNLSSGGAMGALTAFASGGVVNTHNAFGTSAGSNSGDLSDRARSELRKYASSLEQGKLQRRRSC